MSVKKKKLKNGKSADPPQIPSLLREAATMGKCINDAEERTKQRAVEMELPFHTKTQICPTLHGHSPACTFEPGLRCRTNEVPSTLLSIGRKSNKNYTPSPRRFTLPHLASCLMPHATSRPAQACRNDALTPWSFAKRDSASAPALAMSAAPFSVVSHISSFRVPFYRRCPLSAALASSSPEQSGGGTPTSPPFEGRSREEGLRRLRL